MKNFNPDGYSVAEVAQILGCTPATVRSYINKGSLEACMTSDTVEKGHKRRIRITRKQLVDYMRTKKGLYSDSELFKKLCEIETKDESTKKEETTGPEYTIRDISELTGAWAPKNLEANSVLNKTDKETENDVKTRCVLSVDGRISIGNVGRDAMKAIVSALLSDYSFSPNELTIKFN